MQQWALAESLYDLVAKAIGCETKELGIEWRRFCCSTATFILTKHEDDRDTALAELVRCVVATERL